MEAKFYSVQSSSFHINKSNPPQLVVVAAGQVNSSGRSNGKLIPWVYVVQPEDGIQDFDFIATAPGGTVLWVVVIELTVTAEKRPPDGLVVDLLHAGLEIENQNLGLAGVNLDDIPMKCKTVSALKSEGALKHEEFRDGKFLSVLLFSLAFPHRFSDIRLQIADVPRSPPGGG